MSFLVGSDYWYDPSEFPCKWLDGKGGATSSWQDWDAVIVPAIKVNLQKMRDMHLNYLRFHTSAQDWIENPNNYIAHMGQIASLAQTYGITVSYDIYTITRDDYGLAGGPPPLPYPPYLQPAQEAIIPSKEAFIELWAKIADAMKGHSNVILGEIYQEPYGNYRTDPNWKVNDYQPYMDVLQKVIARIRQITNLRIMVMWGYGIGVVFYTAGYTPTTWDPNVRLEEFANDPRVQGTNIFYSFHCYPNEIRVDGQATNLPQYINSFFAWNGIDNLLPNKRIIVGELGGMNDTEFDLTWFANMIDALNSRNVGFAVFCWSCTWTYHGDELIFQDMTLTPRGQILVNKLGGLPTILFTCPTCGAQFSTQAELDAHISTYHPEAPVTYVCSICGAVFNTQAELNGHMAEVHAEQPPEPPTGCAVAALVFALPLARVVQLGILTRIRSFRDRCFPSRLIRFYYGFSRTMLRG